VWDEAQKINGKDPDFHRRDLYESIENGDFPEYELGVQLLAEEDEFKFDLDVLDPTKLWPEEDVPVKLIGKMTLNRNVDNVFAETEQVAFHPGHVVPGIDFTNDPLLQGRLFSYTDTQLIRLGGPNFHELPINRPVCPFHNNQRDGYGRMTINKGPVSYHNNSLANNTPATSTPEEGGYEHYQEKMEGRKVRNRSDSFRDHFTQATMFWNSMSQPEKQHITDAFCFEIGKVKNKSVQQQAIDMFANVDLELAKTVADAVGANMPTGGGSEVTKASPALSQENMVKKPDTRKVGLIANKDGDASSLQKIVQAYKEAGLNVEIISDKLGNIGDLPIDHTFLTGDPVLFDAIYVASVKEDKKFMKESDRYVTEAFNHFKAIGASTTAGSVLADKEGPGVVKGEETQPFVDAVTAHRHWQREV